MNIASDEVTAVQQLIDDNATAGDFLYPMIRGRVVAVNDEDANSYQARLSASRGDSGPRLMSERNLTWTDTQPINNTVVSGQWWAGDTDRAEVSLEKDYADDFNLSIGDELSFDIGGQLIKAQVSNIRTLEWESMSPNFFIILSPPALRSFPSTYMTSFFLKRSEKVFLNQLLTAHPTITVIEIDAMIEQIRSIVDRVTQAVELVLGLVLASGCLVLVASIQASRDARMAEHALVRALGGRGV